MLVVLSQLTKLFTANSIQIENPAKHIALYYPHSRSQPRTLTKEAPKPPGSFESPGARKFHWIKLKPKSEIYRDSAIFQFAERIVLDALYS